MYEIAAVIRTMRIGRRVDHDYERSRAGCHHPVLLAQVLRRHDQRMQSHVLGKPVGEPESSDSDHDEYGGFDIAPFHPKTLPLDARELATTGGV